MPVHDELGKRMKEFYETIPKTRLMRRCPVVIRIDGRSFHTFTRGFNKPFDEVLIKSMQETMKYLCENIQGCVLGYTQSDEISLILVDYKKLNSSAFFDYEVQKVCSTTASMATMAFNKIFNENTLDFICSEIFEDEKLKKICASHAEAVEKGAMFDSRCFNIPKEEVANYVYWRQLDASRNSIQMLGQANFSHRELQHKSCSDIQDMLMTQKGINWNDLPIYQKRGSCCIKETYWVNPEGLEFPSDYAGTDGVIERSRWIVDREIPIFRNEDRQYIERLINFE